MSTTLEKTYLADNAMNTHRGRIVEKIVKHKGYTVREIAHFTNVNRRSVYNWFSQKELNPNIIYRIGAIINHNFHKEFPDLFDLDDFKLIRNDDAPIQGADSEHATFTASNNWQNKYIDILEKYNELLRINSERQLPGDDD